LPTSAQRLRPATLSLPAKLRLLVGGLGSQRRDFPGWGLHMCARQVMRYKKFKKLLPAPAPKTTILTSISQIKIFLRVGPFSEPLPLSLLSATSGYCYCS